MNSLHVEPLDGRTAFEPGQSIEVQARWEFDEPPQAVELRLVWSTRGKGEADLGVAQTVRFENPSASESRQCTLELPESPYSFSGKLISLIWTIELEAEPSGDSVET